MKLELIATATFGLEAVVKREVEALGYKILASEDGKITYLSDERGIVRSNLWLRCADRVLLKMAEFKAQNFEELYQQTKALEWEKLIPIDGQFTVVGTSVKSKLHSVPTCQSITKKAVVDRLSDFYGISHFDEDGEAYTIKFTILKDRVTLTVDTSGAGLHKRGYRIKNVVAPIKETLAAALVSLSFWKNDRVLIDTCCGSGTIPIEAAMIGRNIAPGLNRSFASEGWHVIKKQIWDEERARAEELIDFDRRLQIFALDIDGKAIEAAKENAIEAGVDSSIRFLNLPMEKLTFGKDGRYNKAVIITNPPYGERIGDEQGISSIYSAFKRLSDEEDGASFFVVTADKDFEKKAFGRPGDRRRKLYNGRLEVCYYQYHGKKKPKE